MNLREWYRDNWEFEDEPWLSAFTAALLLSAALIAVGLLVVMLVMWPRATLLIFGTPFVLTFAVKWWVGRGRTA